MRFLLKFFGITLGLIAALCASIAVWGALSPVVVLHYESGATQPLGYFFNDNLHITKAGLVPGETVKFPTAMFPGPDMWILLSFPWEDGDHLEITKPFDRIDVFIRPGGKIERTVIRNRFFSRFTEPTAQCDPC
ncbi:hypothetical protein ACFWP0_04620 [Achromobacter sp. NPDC058515]|uniref:hypothetical protein n=1 Tax=Achromobacter sp. NPDC058515 TaxID=3346533 RepID=UPI0036533B61